MADEQQQPNEQEQNGKVEKKFQKALSAVTAIIGDPNLFKPLKADASTIEVAMQELAKEEKEELVKKLKQEAKNLIVEKRAFDADIKKKTELFNKTILEEKKKFTEKAEGLIKLVENINKIEEDYKKTLLSTVEPIKIHLLSSQELCQLHLSVQDRNV